MTDEAAQNVDEKIGTEAESPQPSPASDSHESVTGAENTSTTEPETSTAVETAPSENVVEKTDKLGTLAHLEEGFQKEVAEVKDALFSRVISAEEAGKRLLLWIEAKL